MRNLLTLWWKMRMLLDNIMKSFKEKKQYNEKSFKTCKKKFFFKTKNKCLHKVRAIIASISWSVDSVQYICFFTLFAEIVCLCMHFKFQIFPFFRFNYCEMGDRTIDIWDDNWWFFSLNYTWIGSPSIWYDEFV